ncbi:IQ motif and SEC7 domain-containing protein 3 [Terrapene carolina triunguis]|uniref:IQ motif and SEC7 domain-containing protein 3 n=1 Tax=Terrapene triunguis TaxID=2587831 RepID=UPI000E77C74E|nr:IQ motif and SEC7 domain-containing protein 3 [Terrapene carolina triunguis]
MESLLENPVRAVLYLKELTAIVQNQQSLIHTQRQRIDELERRLDELSTENRSLRQQHPAPAAEPQPRPPAPPAAAPQPEPEPLQHPQQLPAPQPLQSRQHHPEKDSRERGCCTTLLQHKPAPAIGKGALSRRPE